ncbi:MAG: hypothetical protein FJ138_17415 [Deltaproteobacteria bacterium]|nr:hypothetical protein [Deltaproteobacteria bacterium]
MSAPTFEDPRHPGSRVRLARFDDPDDQRELLRLFDVPMRGSVELVTERSPDFFALYRQQRPADTLGGVECWVYERAGRLLGVGSMLTRRGYVGGEERRVAYFGDLREDPEGRGLLYRFYGDVFDSFVARTGVEDIYTSILASNEVALRALTRRSEKRRRQPHYDLLRAYQAVQLLLPRRAAPPRAADLGGYAVRAATPEDLPRLTALLDEDHRARPFGYCFAPRGAGADAEPGELALRLARWPGFSLRDTLLCHDARGALRACCTLWDPSAVKRYRVAAWRGWMRAGRLAHNLAAPLLNRAPLPPAGEALRYLYLANLSAPPHEPAALRALLLGARAHAAGQGYQFCMAYMDDAHPLLAAFEGLPRRALPFHLYSLRAADAPPRAYPAAGLTGFEISLA